MIDGTTNGPMIMSIKIGAVTRNTLSPADNSRGLQCSVCRIMTGDTPLRSMNLPSADKWRDGCCVATDTIGSQRSGSQVLLDLSAVTMSMGVKVIDMALRTGPAITAIDRGIAMAADA